MFQAIPLPHLPPRTLPLPLTLTVTGKSVIGSTLIAAITAAIIHHVAVPFKVSSIQTLLLHLLGLGNWVISSKVIHLILRLLVLVPLPLRNHQTRPALQVEALTNRCGLTARQANQKLHFHCLEKE